MAMAAPADEMIARMMASDCELSEEEMEDLRAAMADEAATRDVWRRRRRRRKQQQAVDMRALLVHCAQAVDDRRGARELLRQVRQHASPTGDATQRLAHCLAEALEARLAGTGSGSPLLMATPTTNRAEFLKAYRIFVATCCFEKVAFMFANLTICRAAAGRARLHVVDYGLHLGFQWPGLLRWLAARDGGPPEVTITFIDLPQPGFRPAGRIEETGRSLSNYARDIGVPFKFRAIAAARWDAIGAEELGLGVAVDDPGAVVVVNSLFKLETLADDSVVVDCPSPRDRVLGGIRGMRPAVFTHGVVHGFHGSSFPTRFREALFYYSAVFDVLDATMPRGSELRRVLERDVLGPCALNVIACEGRDRTDRFDSYKQWQLRSRRAGLRLLPLDREVVGEVRDDVRKHRYHRDFVISEDHGWLLQGWKGRVLYAHANWVADDDDHTLTSRP
ncbi:scarecrow-like protein 9 [Panicum virgatum]|uniref:scarecrow-like protein 9 n=1 Tax=Panicum virgatum TaxID=38727 RepID=UPI0019D58172|nr:scarecrow-like protein 9 [Panicum virgatum]